ncbi:MAG TPA: MATE family efflux transporter [Acholeplasmatales bacterium]|nr:MATE family efflux transporter [Acholeplasmatales bacterium]
MKKYFGNKAFYKTVLLISLPVMLQQGLSSFVNFLDNVMVGSLGTEAISGVAIANQLTFVYNLCIFGALSGASIFATQFFGAKNVDGIRSCFRFKWLIGVAVFLVALLVIGLFSEPLISLFLNESEEAVGDPELVLSLSHDYLQIMLLGLLPFALSQVYSTSLRETKHTIIPMVSGIIAVVVNFGLNYILIFGHLGFEAMGVRGAAIATVVSRVFELGVLVAYVHVFRKNYPFIQGIYKTLRVPWDLVKRISLKGLPLLVNEFFWSMGMTTLFQIYSVRGLMVVTALNISSTFSNLFMVIFSSLGSATAIIIGQHLGASELEEAKDASRKLLFLTFVVTVILGSTLIITSKYIPQFYNTTADIRDLATQLMMVAGLFFPMYAFNMQCYFTLRAGGVTFATILFDSVFLWVVMIPFGFILTHWTGTSILLVYFFVQLSELIKSVIGYAMIKKGIWLKNIVAKPTEALA